LKRTSFAVLPRLRALGLMACGVASSVAGGLGVAHGGVTAADSAATTPAPATGGIALTVHVENVRNDHGHVHVALCRHDQFLTESCAMERTVPAHAGTTTVVFDSVASGEWAAQAFHDENDNKKVDQVLFGIPKEGVGFSRNARIVMSPPKWAHAAFSVDGKAQTIRFNLRYFLGAGSPQEWAKTQKR
jgi:uncharacterized protein (DUF2141 family)